MLKILFLLLSFTVYGNVLDDAVKESGVGFYEVGVSKGRGPEAARDLIINISKNIMLPIIISISLILGIISFYKLKISTNTDDMKKTSWGIMWGMIGIIIMVSSIFIVGNLINQQGDLTFKQGGNLAIGIYNQIIFPFLRLALFIVSSILFIILLIHARKMIISKEDVRNKAKTIVIRNSIGILLIIGATYIVEIVYGSIKGNSINPTDLGGIAQGAFKNKQLISFIGTTINYINSFIAIAIIIIIVYQSYKLLVNPEDESNFKSLKRSILYIFLGMLILFTGYLITNFIIIK